MFGILQYYGDMFESRLFAPHSGFVCDRTDTGCQAQNGSCKSAGCNKLQEFWLLQSSTVKTLLSVTVLLFFLKPSTASVPFNFKTKMQWGPWEEATISDIFRLRGWRDQHNILKHGFCSPAGPTAPPPPQHTHSLIIFMIINAFLMCWIHLWYTCEVQSATHETLQQYTA